MSVAAIAWARRQKTGSPTMKAVLVAVADYADERGRAWPSQKRIADDTELSTRSVRDALAGLEAKGLLSREPYIREDNSRGADRITLAISEATANAAGGAEARSGGRERVSEGVGKELPGGGEARSPLTTFEPPPEPSEEPKERRAPRAAVSSDAEFADWYGGYPHKVGKAEARKAFEKARRKASLEELIAGRDRYIRDKPPDRSWCNPATFLNQERWTDEPSTDQPQANGFASGHHAGRARGGDAVLAGMARVARHRGLAGLGNECGDLAEGPDFAGDFPADERTAFSYRSAN